MVSIRLITLTAWLLLMLNISLVFGVPKSEVGPTARKVIRNLLKESRVNVYHNQYLYFCVIYQHWREYFEEDNSVVLYFLDDLHLTPRTVEGDVHNHVYLTAIRANLRDWIPEYRRRVAKCPDIQRYIPQNFNLQPSLAGLINDNVREARYGPIANALKQDYVLYRQTPPDARGRLVGEVLYSRAWTLFAQRARARFIKTVLQTFDNLLAGHVPRQVGPDQYLVAQQVNPVVFAPIAPAPVAPAAVPATNQQAQVPNPSPRVPSPRQEPQIVPNTPPRVPSPQLVPQIVPNPPPRVPSPRLVPQIVAPNPRPPYIPSGLDFLAELASRLKPIPHVHRHVQVQKQQDNQPVPGPVRPNRRRDRLEQHDGGPPRGDHDHYHRRNGPRQD